MRLINNSTPHVPANILGLHQEGGEMVGGDPMLEEEAPAQDPMQQMAALAAQALEGEGDCNAAMSLAEMVMQAMQASPQ